MKYRDPEEITEELLEARKEENGGVKVLVLQSLILAGDMKKSEKDIPPGAVIMLSKKEYEKLSKRQREPFVDDIAGMRKKLREMGISEEKIEKLSQAQQDKIDFIKSQPGGKRKLENLKAKCGPIVKKTSRPLSTPEEIKALREKRQAEWDLEVEEAEEQVRVSR